MVVQYRSIIGAGQRLISRSRQGLPQVHWLVSVAPSMNNSNPVQFDITAQPLLLSWLDQDVGPVALPGSATYTNGVFTVSGSGQSIGGTSDQMHFVYQPLSGNGTVVARVTEYLTGRNLAQAGVMIRETLSTSATNAYAQSYASSSLLYRSSEHRNWHHVVEFSKRSFALLDDGSEKWK